MCFGPLEVVYDYDAIARGLTREAIEARPRNLWRYRELLPIAGDPVRRPALRLHAAGPGRSPGGGARACEELYIKDDSVNHPTLSYKDRVVSVAVTSAIELGFDTVSLRVDRQPGQQRLGARRARRASTAVVFIPDNLEQGKILGSAHLRPAHGGRSAATTTT